MRDRHIVVGESVNEHERAIELRRVGDDAVTFVHGRVEAEVTLGVVRVVQRPVGRGCAGAGRSEGFRRFQHGERGKESAVRPADHGHAVEVRLRDGVFRGFLVFLRGQCCQRFRQRTYGVDLVFERHGFHGFVDGTIPLRAASGGAASVGGDHDIALVGPPLRIPVERLAFDDLLESGAAVRLHEHRQSVGMRVFATSRGEHDCRVQATFAKSGEVYVRRESGGFGMVFDWCDHH